MDRPRFMYPFICGWTLGCFYLLFTVNSAAVNMDAQVVLL